MTISFSSQYSSAVLNSFVRIRVCMQTAGRESALSFFPACHNSDRPGRSAGRGLVKREQFKIKELTPLPSDG